MQPVIYADLRCLQDPDFQHRGIGYHTAALLRARKRSRLSDWKTVGLIDPRLPQLPVDLAAIVDEISPSVNPCVNNAPAVFIDGSPMTHDMRFNLRFLSHPAFFRAAVLYDFIPLDWPGYLNTVPSRMEYLAKLARLRNFDLFFPISQYTAWRLSELLGVCRSRIHVTGASVRRSLYEISDTLESESPYSLREPYFVTVGGNDRRKNTEVVVKAVKRLNLLYARRIPLKVIGYLSQGSKAELLRLAGHSEGSGFLELYPSSSDEALISIHAGAIAAIAASFIEGFSLPVVEASVCGCPVVASVCAAHVELMDDPDALFEPDDSVALSEKLEALLQDPNLRASLAKSQAHLANRFHEDDVGRRFWDVIVDGIDNRRQGAAIARPQKPRVAFLSPYPPDRSGVAQYTALTIQAGEKVFHSDLYTDAARPLTFDGPFRDGGGVSLAPLVSGRYDGVISVIGNSAYHTRIFEFIEQYGGPCILHDARLTHIYFHRLGQNAFLNFAGTLLGRSVSMDEVSIWLQDRDLPSLFLDRIIERASPLIVHTATQRAEIKRIYGVDAHVATSCPTVFFGHEDLTDSAKQAARDRQGIPGDVFAISSFGFVGREKGIATCIFALELLRSWNIPAELYFVGDAGVEQPEIDRISTLYGVRQYVHSAVGFVTYNVYRDFLTGSDAGVQLRVYGFGQFSAALTDCISAGLPSVAPCSLAKSCDAPSFILTVPERFSPLQVAEQLAIIWESHASRDSNTDGRATYLQTHNFDFYAKRLIEILDLA